MAGKATGPSYRLFGIRRKCGEATPQTCQLGSLMALRDCRSDNSEALCRASALLAGCLLSVKHIPPCKLPSDVSLPPEARESVHTDGTVDGRLITTSDAMFTSFEGGIVTERGTTKTSLLRSLSKAACALHTRWVSSSTGILVPTASPCNPFPLCC